MNSDNRVTLSISITVFMMVAIITACYIFFPNWFGNKAVADLSYKFKYADVSLGGNVKTYKIKKWTDYDNSEQIQIWTEDGNVLLVSSFNTVLRKQ